MLFFRNSIYGAQHLDESINSSLGLVTKSEFETLVDQAIELFRKHPHPSITAIERNLRPGYAVSAKVLNELENRRIVSEILPDGTRRFLGTGAHGIEQFKALAEELRFGLEPASHWFRHLSLTAKHKYLPGLDGALAWGDLSDADRARLRTRYHKNLNNLALLKAQFSYLKTGVLS